MYDPSDSSRKGGTATDGGSISSTLTHTISRKNSLQRYVRFFSVFRIRIQQTVWTTFDTATNIRVTLQEAVVHVKKLRKCILQSK